MKNSLIVLYLIVAFLLFSCLIGCSARKSEPITQETFAPSKEDVKKGEEHFMHHCQKCHPGGEAGLGPSINAYPAPQFLKRFQVRHGLGVMPSFKKDEISKEDLRNISAYLKAWKHY